MTFYASLALESSEIWERYYKSLLYNSHGKISYEAIRTEFSYLPMHVTTDLHLTYMATHGLEKICSSSWWEEILHSWHRAAACPWALSHRESCVSSPVPAAGGWPWGALTELHHHLLSMNATYRAIHRDWVSYHTSCPRGYGLCCSIYKFRIFSSKEGHPVLGTLHLEHPNSSNTRHTARSA